MTIVHRPSCRVPAVLAALLAAAGVAAGQDLDGNLQQDSLEIRQGAPDCNRNGTLDIVDISRPHLTSAVEHLNGLVQFQNSVWDVAPLDFDLDGRMDLALCAFTSTDFGHVALWRNDGGPGLVFHGEILFSDARPTIIKSADFDADGRADLAVADSSYGRVYVLRATGNGAFAPPVTLTFAGANNGSVGLAVGDVDNDGDADIAATAWGANSVSVWRNNGAGAFGPAAPSPTGAQPRDVAIGDLTGDGLPDLAVANETSSGGSEGTVSVLRNTGTGFVAHATVTPPRGRDPYLYPARPHFVEIRDTDHDGDGDLVVSSRLSSVLSIHRNSGAGAFTLAQSFGGYPIEGDPADIKLADLDADGWEEIVWGDPDTSAFSVLRNDAGTFVHHQSFATSSYGGLYLAVADFSGDGRPDVVTANDAARTFSIAVNQGDLRFDAATRYRLTEYPGRGILADFDNDGTADLGTVTTNNAGTAYTFTLHAGLGDVRYAETPIVTPLGAAATTPFARDFNNDGNLDLLSVGGGLCQVRLGTGTGAFGPAISSPITPAPLRLTIADYSGDGVLDLMWLWPGHPGSARISIGDGLGGFGPHTEYTMFAEDESVGFGDITGDGAPEFFAGFRQQLAPPAGGVLAWLPNNGDGTFGPRQARYITASPLSPAVGAIAVADFDGDGDGDVAVGAAGIRLFRNPGAGDLPATPEVASATPASILVAADIDVDGDTDLYARNAGLSVLLNNGDGTFPPAMHLPRYDSNYRDLFVADADSDGRPDALVRPENCWSHYLYLNKPPLSTDANGNGVPDDCETRCAADADANGSVTSADISYFLAMWIASLQGGTLQGDFNGDAAVNSGDISAFLAAWLAAVQNGC